MTSRASIFIACALLGACVTPTDDIDCSDGKCDVDQSCSDPQYGDGVCQTNLTCAVPDIDCFRTFDNDADAAAWYTGMEAMVAQAEGRAPRKVLDSSDPRFPKMRELLDRGWEAMRHQVPVGKLGEKRPGLVFVEDPTVNAFVDPEDLQKKRASFAVMIHTTTLDTATSDDATLGLVMHELKHAVGLHVVEGVPDAIAKFYLASDYDEPIGAEQADSKPVRDAVGQWRGFATEIGPFSQEAAGGLPLGGLTQRIFKTVLGAGIAADAAACAHTKDLLVQVTTDITSSLDPISTAITLDPSYAANVSEAMRAARDECLRTFTASFVEVAAQLVGVTPEMIEAQLTPEDKALVDGKHVIDAIDALTQNRRTAMRALEGQAESQLGAPWTAVRFYSEEENADENSVIVLRGAGLDPTGLATFFREVLMTKPQTEACDAVLATGAVPAYGVDVQDTHHGNCWRVFHQHAFADHTARARVRTPTLHPVTKLLPKMPFAVETRYSMY